METRILCLLFLSALVFLDSASVYTLSSELELIDAVKKGNIKKIINILKHDTNKTLLNHASSFMNWTPLMWACSIPESNSTAYLIKAGADLNSRAVDGKTPLIVASVHGSVGAIQALIAHRNIDINARDKDGYSAIHRAVTSENFPIIRQLLIAGADADLSTNRGYGALHIAAGTGQLHILKFLIKHKVDVNKRAFDGDTPLLIACTAADANIVSELVLAGASVNIRGSVGLTAIIRACMSRCTECVNVLIAAKADLSLISDSGNSFSSSKFCSDMKSHTTQ